MPNKKRASFRAEKGLIEVELTLAGGVISFITITGDFFIHPEEALEKLEKQLIGVEATEEAIKKTLEQFYIQNQILSPGITSQDIATVIINAINN